MKYYLCERCGNLVTKIIEKPCTPMCCGQPMKELEPNTVEAAFEKHIPVVEIAGNTVTVKVGEVDHPMLEEHYIQFIVLETKQGVQLRKLAPDEAPCAVFALAEGDEAVAALEYCNLHGLWKKEL